MKWRDIIRLVFIGKLFLFILLSVAGTAAFDGVARGENDFGKVIKAIQNLQSQNVISLPALPIQGQSVAPEPIQAQTQVRPLVSGTVAVKIEDSNSVDRRRLQTEVEEAMFRYGYNVVSVDDNRYDGVNYILTIYAKTVEERQYDAKTGNLITVFTGANQEKQIVEASVKLTDLMSKRVVAFGKGLGDSTNQRSIKIEQIFSAERRDRKDIRYLSTLLAAISAVQNLH